MLVFHKTIQKYESSRPDLYGSKPGTIWGGASTAPKASPPSPEVYILGHGITTVLIGPGFFGHLMNAHFVPHLSLPPQTHLFPKEEVVLL